ncbi:DNA mismatch repair protein MutS [Desulfonauticus submarinus]|uniref:DNA mismatch repair protein MutS n=1 Tax=Desulfonauticus submarinus TaxID=206665 RepID=A0A1H0A1R3_9BACT|nr:DNA mismatch repair protein MutS [Desulfonauticus submarinus]SDN27111.1 DNA mismatch repair protein MutS [Desulfonauticus submarinus]
MSKKNFNYPSKLKLTPMLEQYLGIKQNYQDCLLFFRMGDFYELFFEDAKIAARELQIALTSRNPNADTKIPMCGVPHHAVNEYLKKLLNKGYKIAICDQVEDPKLAKKIVKREVTKVLTPGTVVEDLNLESKNNNFLVSIFWNEKKQQGAIAWADFSTGFWTGIQTSSLEEIWQWLFKLNPNEILVPDNFNLPIKNHNIFKDKIRILPKSSYYSLNTGTELLYKAEQITSLKTLDLEDKPELVRVCGSILSYHLQTQKTNKFHLHSFTVLNPTNYLILDEITERNLELFTLLDGKKGPGTLIYILDNTLTPMGGRLLKERLSKPWRKVKIITQHQEVVSFFYTSDELRNEIRSLLNKVYDLERLAIRIFLSKTTPKDLVSLKETLTILPQVHLLLKKQKNIPHFLIQNYKKWDNLEDIKEILEKAILDNPSPLITEGNIFKLGFDKQLDDLIDLTEHGEQKLKELLKKEQEKHNIPQLKLGYNKVFGYYLELSKVHKDKVPSYFERKQTLVNSERFITPELKELEDKILIASEKRKLREYELFQSLRDQLAQQKDRFLFMAKQIAELDYWQSLAETARKWGWTKPEITTSLELEIKQGRHPSIEGVIGKNNYIPNDIILSNEAKLLIITGPNMAGKSTILRQTAIICILTQMGSFVPASYAKIGITDRIFSRVGASDNLAQGQSTFMVEMTETARILRLAGRKSLVILDEIGRGTSTFDGMALAWAVAEELSKRQVRTLFATHYHELTQLEQEYPNIRNFNIAVKEWKGEIIFLRKLIPGPADKSYGIEVAKLAGVPNQVIARAKEILNALEQKEAEIKKKIIQKNLLSFLPKTKNFNQKIATHPILEELKHIDPNNLTPIMALNILNSWKQKWGKYEN